LWSAVAGCLGPPAVLGPAFAQGARSSTALSNATWTIESAYATAPETIRYNGFARDIILEDLNVRDIRRQERASRLARNIGLLSA
jgi:hypothetical protein